jgi:ATP-dependent DNA ligase
MELPVRPPVPPMLARLARDLPRDGYLYEPKWDGFRAMAFREGGNVDLRSRNDRPFGRYFPEVVEALVRLSEQRILLDGELVAVRQGRLVFDDLLGRLHPAASRVERLRHEVPARFISFDILALGGDDLRGRPFSERRALLEAALGDAPEPLAVTPITDDPDVAALWLERFQGAGIDGVVAKRRDLIYRPGVRAMVKVKREQTADCVVGGYRPFVDVPLPASLLLGLYDPEGVLHHVGVASSFTDERRRKLLEELSPLATSLSGHPWEEGYLLGGGRLGRLAGSAGRWTPDMGQDWVPVRPELVCEVAYDQVDDHRFRHPARFVRWRPDRDPRSCTTDQLDVIPPDIGRIVAS